MATLIDLFGYLSVLVHGLSIVAQSMALGGALFLILLARPMAASHPDGARIARQTAAWAGWSAVAVAGLEVLSVAMSGAVLVTTLDVGWPFVLGAQFAAAGAVKAAAALLLAVALLRGAAAPVVLALAGTVLAAATLATHAAARVDHGAILLAAAALHMLGAAIWVGGIPFFVLALARLQDGAALRRVGARFSRMSMAGVACILVSAAVFAVLYVGTPDALYGTAYGVMVGAKAALFGALLLLGLGNFLVVERLRRDPATPVLRLRRFAEVEIGVGFSLFFAAASLTSVPPAVDLVRDRVTWSEVVERNVPVPPRLVSPDYDALALPALQARLDAEAARTRTTAAAAFVPGGGELPDRNASDVAWSEYNHHWSGLFVLGIGLAGLLSRGGAGWARHWPLGLLGLAGFLFVRSDPEVWPLGSIGFFESLRDVEVLQHRMFVLLILVFALFEWAVRTGRLRTAWAPLVFPLMTALGGALLLTHTHAVANVRDQLLIELSHTPLALAGIAAGWARWLEVRGDGPVRRWSGWVWPVCFMLVGAILLNYREA